MTQESSAKFSFILVVFLGLLTAIPPPGNRFLFTGITNYAWGAEYNSL